MSLCKVCPKRPAGIQEMSTLRADGFVISNIHVIVGGHVINSSDTVLFLGPTLAFSFCLGHFCADVRVSVLSPTCADLTLCSFVS